MSKPFSAVQSSANSCAMLYGILENQGSTTTATFRLAGNIFLILATKLPAAIGLTSVCLGSTFGSAHMV